jgi:predicted transcriptional regulator
MVKTSISFEIPSELANSLDKIAKNTGRKKTLLIGASLFKFVKSDKEEQEEIIGRYLETYKK